MGRPTQGVSASEDLNPELLARDTRSFGRKFREGAIAGRGQIMMGFGVIIMANPFLPWYQFSDILTAAGLLFMFMWGVGHHAFPESGPIWDKKGKGDGVMHLGEDYAREGGLFLSDSDMREHMLVFGSTGSGKTRFLLGIFYQAMATGSGVIYVDGKGDNTVFALAYALCRRLGRLDDLLIINYMTSGETKDKSSFLSNTTNPFASGNHEQIRSMFVGLMRDSGGEGDMWKGRTSAMIGALLRALVWTRDHQGIPLNIARIRQFLPLDEILALSQDVTIDPKYRAPLDRYLLELPGYTAEDAATGDIAPKVYEQHGFLIMQLTEVMADLSETLGHIFNAELGDVDFKDVVFNRRILFVLLPAIEKDPDALAGLGKLIVSGVRSALASALGSKPDGSRRDMIDNKPTNASVPYYLIFDEYGYYAVKGFAIVAAQARSLGMSVIFASQDYPSLKKASEEEAASTVANTGIKICMRLEDPKDTFELFRMRAGEAFTSFTSGSKKKESGSYKDQDDARNEKRDRINMRDLVAQEPGEAHIIHRDNLYRSRLFYADLPLPEEIRLNKFLIVVPPTKKQVDAKIESLAGLRNILKGGMLEEDKCSLEVPENLDIFFQSINYAKRKGKGQTASTIIALESVGLIEDLNEMEIKRKTFGDPKDSGEPTERKLKEPEEPSIQVGDESTVFDINDRADVSAEYREAFEGRGLTPEQKEEMLYKNQVESISEGMGKTRQALQKDEEDSGKLIANATEYPVKPFPTHKPAPAIFKIMDNVKNKLKKGDAQNK